MKFNHEFEIPEGCVSGYCKKCGILKQRISKDHYVFVSSNRTHFIDPGCVSHTTNNRPFNLENFDAAERRRLIDRIKTRDSLVLAKISQCS